MLSGSSLKSLPGGSWAILAPARALLELPAATARASARPRGLSYAVAIRRNRQASLLEAETTKTAVSDFFGGAAAPGGLRLPPPSLRSWEKHKKS